MRLHAWDENVAVRTLIVLLSALLTTGVVAGADTRAAEQGTVRSHLPVVALDAEEPITGEVRVVCSVRMILPSTGGELGNTNTMPGRVRIHGGVSRGFPKKSYAVTLDSPVAWLGLRPSANWVLNAAFVDRSLMRHKLSYDLFRSLSAPGLPRYAAESRFIEVQVNGRYQGAYLLIERVDRAGLGLRAFDSNAPNHACIYKAEDHAANFSSPGHAGYEQREPDPVRREYWEPLNAFNRFVSRSPEPDFRDPEKGVGSRLDLANAIDFHLLVLLTSNGDGITKNFMIARDAFPTNAPAARFFFVPWDYDATFGRDWNASRVEPTVWLSNTLFERLMEVPDYRGKFASRWRELRAKQFSVATIQRLMDDNARALGGAVRRNQERWRNQTGMYPDQTSFEEDVAQMKEWIVARLKWLDAEIERRAR